MTVTKPTPKVLVASKNLTTDPIWAAVFEMKTVEMIEEPDPANIIASWLENIPDLILFEITPLNNKTLNLIKNLRGGTVIPILLLTTCQDTDIILRAYEAGVDDCILQPITPAILQAKLRAWLRRSSNVPVETLDPLHCGRVGLLPSKRLASVDDQESVRLTNLQMRLLYALMSRPGEPIGAEELIEKMWGSSEYADMAALKNVAYRLRKKIEANPARPRFILNVAGAGYLFNAEA